MIMVSRALPRGTMAESTLRPSLACKRATKFMIPVRQIRTVIWAGTAPAVPCPCPLNPPADLNYGTGPT